MTSVIEQYLEELRRELWSGSPFKERLLWEIEAHLREAAEREQAEGTPPEEAQQHAIERFGAPHVLAPLYLADLAAPGRRRMRGGLMEKARLAIRQAQQEAERRGHASLDTEHLLLGLLRDEESCAVVVLERLGLSPERLRTEIEAHMAPGTRGPRQDLQMTAAARRALELADEEAEAFDLYFTSTEHLLLGLIREGEGLAAQILSEHGVDLDRARAKVGEVFAQWTEIAAAQRARREAAAPD